MYNVCACVRACVCVSYSGKDWWVESLANHPSAIRQAKAIKIINNPLADLVICQTFSTKPLKRVNLPNILHAKLSCYMVCA